jgi:benzoyl-CoA reductase/2-hydroxyglutaryl-CoA dehydratase subunit BcrC/BadD/HgdB
MYNCNDGSPDDTESVAKRWCTKDSRIKYLSRKIRDYQVPGILTKMLQVISF